MCDLKIIGITRTECECFPKDTEANLSNVYLSELDGFGLETLEKAEDCQHGEWKTRCENAITASFTRLNSDILKGLGENKAVERIKSTNGTVGYGKQEGGLVSTLKKHLVYRVVLKNTKKQQVKIPSLGLFFENSSALTLTIYDPFGEVYGTPITLNPSAGKYKMQTVDITLDADVDGWEYVEYLFVINIENNKPYKLKHVCCGDAYKFDYNDPCFKYNSGGWRSIMMVGYDVRDFNISNLSDITDTAPIYKKFAGLTLQIKNVCDDNDALCSTGIDYTNSDIGVALALALRYKTAIKIYHDILNRPNVDLVNPGNMAATAQMWADKYAGYISYLVNGSVKELYGCFVIKQRIFRTGIRL